MSDSGEKPLLSKAPTGTSKGLEETRAEMESVHSGVAGSASSTAGAPPRSKKWLWYSLAIAAVLLCAGLVAGLVVGLQNKNASASSTSSSTAPTSADTTKIAPGASTTGSSIITLYIASEQKDCVAGVMPMKCLQVTTDLGKPYGLFYDQIRNFTYVPGYTYELRVSKTPVENPPADGSSFYYTCLEVVAKVALPKEEEELPPFQNTDWILAGFPSTGREVIAGPRGKPTFSVAGGRISGLGSVNRYTGPITISGTTISIGNIASTRMMGPPEMMDQEGAMLKALANCTSYRVVMRPSGTAQLELLDANKVVLLVFDPPKKTLDSLLGTSWILAKLNGAVPLERKPTLDFSKTEPVRAAGVATINHYSTSCTIDGVNITFGKNMVMTMMAGPPAQMEQETVFAKTISEVVGYDIKVVDGVQTMTMHNADQQEVLAWTQALKATA